MRIPISETDKGYFYTIGDYAAHFVHENNALGLYRKYRYGTWAEFKELYPYYNGNSGYRSKQLTKYNSRWNKNC